MTDNQGMLPPAGWYPDPFGAPHERWWDGTQWTDHTNVPAPPAAPTYVEPSYVEPSPAEPVVEQPVQPTYEPQPYQQPAYEQPSYVQPTVEQQPYEESKYEPTAHQQPAAYTAPAYAEPSYAEPAYSEPAYRDPETFQPPAQQVRAAESDHAFEFGLLVSGAAGSGGAASGASTGNEDFGSWAGSEYVEPVRNTPATAGLTFGVLSFILPVLGGALGLVFSVIGLGRAANLAKEGDGPIGRGKSIAGLVLSVLGSAASVAFLIFGLPGVLASLQAGPLVPDSSGESVDGTQLTQNGNIPLELGATGTFTPDGADAPSIQFVVTGIAVDDSCTVVAPDNGQYLAVTMELTTSSDYLTTTTGGGSLHVNASDWMTFLDDGSMIVNTDDGTECVAEDKRFPLEIVPGTTVTGTIFVDTTTDSTALAWAASEIVAEDPASARWEWAIPRS